MQGMSPAKRLVQLGWPITFSSLLSVMNKASIVKKKKGETFYIIEGDIWSSMHFSFFNILPYTKMNKFQYKLMPELSQTNHI